MVYSKQTIKIIKLEKCQLRQIFRRTIDDILTCPEVEVINLNNNNLNFQFAFDIFESLKENRPKKLYSLQLALNPLFKTATLDHFMEIPAQLEVMHKK